MPYEITIYEVRLYAEAPNGEQINHRIKRLEMTIDGELDIPTIIKAITIPKHKRKGKVSA